MPSVLSGCQVRHGSIGLRLVTSSAVPPGAFSRWRNYPRLRGWGTGNAAALVSAQLETQGITDTGRISQANYLISHGSSLGRRHLTLPSQSSARNSDAVTSRIIQSLRMRNCSF
jgi:hypothetical protein